MYTIFEPELPGHIDNEALVKCLEYIRIKLPNFIPNLNEKCEVNIIAVKSPHGEDYPAYGIIMNEGFDIEDVKMKIDELINNISINIILENSIKVDSISWESIKAKVD
jgi:hypothetical protein